MPNTVACSFLLRCDPSHLQIAHPSLTLVPRFYLFGRRGFVIQRFVLKYFERVLVLLLVASLLVINSLIEQKFAFLSFYYLPIILAGFYGGRRFAVVAGLFVASLVFFFQAPQGLGLDAGLTQDPLTLLIPWGGFLSLTGHGGVGLAEQRATRL